MLAFAKSVLSLDMVMASYYRQPQSPTMRSPIAVVVLLIILAIFILRARFTPVGLDFRPSMLVTDINVDPVAFRDFWSAFHELLQRRHPGDKIPETEAIGGSLVKFRRPQPRYNKITLSNEQHQVLQGSHKGVLQDIRAMDHDLPYKANTRGIVTFAGGMYAIPSLVTIRLLRDTGCTLPVEVIVKNKHEYDTRLCDDVFPALNVRCVVLESMLGENLTSSLSGHGHQLKVFAVLSSSFEQNLFLDADSLPLRDPTYLFTEEPFRSSGYILWPDVWYRTEAPIFFDIANITMPIIDARHTAVDSGQFMFSKRTHQNTLLLAAYYNYYGPDWYWNLIMQSTHGKGDKDTFRAAADVTGENMFIVDHSPTQLGSVRPYDKWPDPEESINPQKHNWALCGMVQFDPMDEFRGLDPRPLFMHQQKPKLDPGSIFATRNTSFIFGWDGQMQRTWETRSLDPLVRDLFRGEDYELNLWESVRMTTCAYASLFTEDACRMAHDYVEVVRSTPQATEQAVEDRPRIP